MSMQDPISDLLTRIRNGQAINKKSVVLPSSKQKISIVKVLQDEGYVSGYTIKDENPKKPELEVELKYHNGKPVIAKIARASKPSLRKYCSTETLPKVLGGLGTAIISTSKGVMSDKQAKKQGVGGEVLCVVE